ncbi:hypothetical protein F5144DRAFT_563217 [Chaetomium tenue]|uniref:Uncharacterized protein n=1 Tax=Chaetomium tenue TaxID=1854479 RepID=A0ACB7PMP3_9PEZI|nr:hypothetical protein F5144DRAFT_563217 [Chaetomium globosum]
MPPRPTTIVSQPPLQTWRPPADPNKPLPCPYQKDFTVNITSHIPPAPFGGRDYGPGTRVAVTDQALRSLKQTELVMANPPLQPATPIAGTSATAATTPRTCTLLVTRPLAVVDGRGAQLAVCTIAPMPPKPSPGQALGQAPAVPAPFQAVAKIYDPLYYSFASKIAESVPCDVTWLADQDYSREAAAYQHLQNVKQTGAFAPRYFGSWTFTIGIRIGSTIQSRPVRLILIEYIQGPSLRELYSAARFDDAYRLEVLARVLDGDAKLRLSGIDQRDLAARNVVLKFPSGVTEEAQPKTMPRLVLIDYNSSVVYAKTIRGRGPCDGMTLPPNPMWLHWDDPLQEFWGWIPDEWQRKPRLRQEWLRKRFGGKDTVRSYAPVPDKLE